MTLLILALIYFTPVFIAFGRHHKNAWPIFWFSTLLGWSVLGWIIALIWASTDQSKPTVIVMQQTGETSARKVKVGVE